MIAAVGPEELRVVGNSCARHRIDSLGMRHDLFEHSFLPQTIGGKLIVDDGIDRDRSLCQPIRERLLARRQGLKTRNTQEDEGGITHALDHYLRIWLVAASGTS